MRECKKVVRLLQTKKYSEVRMLIRKYANSNNRKVFVGIREDTITLYYMNALVIKIQSKDNNLEYVVNEKFLGGNQTSYEKKDFSYIKKNIELILDKIEHEKLKEERKLQQWILTENNFNTTSKWYFVDMEYNTQGVYAGRIDLIAISKSKNSNGKYEVALVELKVGDGSIKGISHDIRQRGVIKSEEDKEEEKNFLFKQIKTRPEFIYDRQSKEVNYGSGIVGHIADYLRYLERDYYNELLRREICNIISTHRSLGILPDCLAKNEIEFGDICSKPQVHFIFYSESKYGTKKCSLFDVKDTVYESLFGEKGDSLCDEINSEDIKEFLCKKEEFKDSNRVVIEKNIKGQSYMFYFTFIDGKCEDSWNCLN